MYTENKQQKYLGRLIVVCGLSGSGKTTLIRETVAKITNISYLRTCTTRAPRSEEEAQSSIEYIFVTKEQYYSLRCRCINWDHSDIYGNWYGASIDEAIDLLNSGKNLIVASQPTIKAIDDLRQKYSSNTKIVLLDVPQKVTQTRITMERNRQEQRIRSGIDAQADVDAVRQIAHSAFTPSMNLQQDVVQFCTIIEGLIR